MKLVVLGSGTSVPHADRSAAAYWVETDRGTLLLDVGPDAPHRMAQEGLDWPNLDAIWISHFHLDHIGGLAPYLFGARWAPQTRDRRKPLRIYGPKGLKSVIQKFNDANDYKLFEQVFPIELIEVKADREFEILTELRATTLSTPHTPESLAIRLIEKNGKTLVYSSDTGFSENFIDFSKRVSLLLLECSFRRNKPSQTHLEFAEAMRIIRDCQPRTAVLTHFYPEWDLCGIGDEAGTRWSGKVLEAIDGLRLDI